MACRLFGVKPLVSEPVMINCYLDHQEKTLTKLESKYNDFRLKKKENNENIVWKMSVSVSVYRLIRP